MKKKSDNPKPKDPTATFHVIQPGHKTQVFTVPLKPGPGLKSVGEAKRKPRKRA